MELERIEIPRGGAAEKTKPRRRRQAHRSTVVVLDIKQISPTSYVIERDARDIRIIRIPVGGGMTEDAGAAGTKSPAAVTLPARRYTMTSPVVIGSVLIVVLILSASIVRPESVKTATAFSAK